MRIDQAHQDFTAGYETRQPLSNVTSSMSAPVPHSTGGGGLRNSKRRRSGQGTQGEGAKPKHDDDPQVEHEPTAELAAHDEQLPAEQEPPPELAALGEVKADGGRVGSASSRKSARQLETGLKAARQMKRHRPARAKGHDRKEVHCV